MATAEQNAFINSIAPLVAKYAPQYGIYVVSTIVAQAIVESGWGTSDLAKRHNYFGLKCRSNWTGPSYSKLTNEEYEPGVVTTITDNFRVYGNMEEGVKGYFEFLFDPIAGGRYNNLKGITDPYRYAQIIKDDGYCTRSDYVQQLTRIINDYDLTHLDKLGGSSMPKLFVVCGHGAGDTGAGGNGYNEAERVRYLAAEMKRQAGDQIILGDTSINWYASKSFNTLANPGCPVVELHMDSGGTARGGHVIIKSGFNADQYDQALANYIASVFPGRAERIVGRSDLQNVNICARRGINYRLLEVCFITSYNDLHYFNDHVSEIAAGILACFGVSTSEPAPAPNPEPERRRDLQVWHYNDSDAQRWWLRDLGNGKYALRNSSCWDWLSNPGMSQEAIAAETWGGTGGDDGNQNPRDPQILTIEKLGNGLVKIHPACAPHLSLDVYGGSIEAGQAVWWWPSNSTEWQKWYMYADEDGAYRICSVRGFKMLDCPNGGWW